MRKNILILILSMIMLIGIVSATTYYVSPTGDDTAAGTEGDPWLSIGTHLYGATHTNIGSGDTLFIKNGTYNEAETALYGLYITKSVTIIGEDRDNVIVNFIDDAYQGFYPDDVTLKLYNLTLTSEVDSIGASGVNIRDQSDNTIIENVKFKNFQYGVNQYSSGDGANNVTIKNNIFENIYYPVNYKNKWEYCSFFNNTLINVSSYGHLFTYDLASEPYMNTYNNSYGLQVYTKTDASIEFDNKNTIASYDRLRLIDFNPEETYVVKNKDIKFDDMSPSSISYGIYLENVSNIAFNDITYCNNSLCDFSNTASVYLLYGTSVHNSSFSGFEIDAKSSGNLYSFYIGGRGNNVSNMDILHDAPYGAGIKISGSYNMINDNVVDIKQNSISYAIGVGTEGLSLDGVRAHNNIIKNNIVYANTDKISTTLHTYFLGYNNNSQMINNIQYGGGYGHVIKGNVNCIVDGSKIYDGYNNVGILEKGGENNIFRNIYIEARDDSNRIFDIRSDSVPGFQVKNSTWENINALCSGDLCGYGIYSNGTVYFKDIVGDYNKYIGSTSLLEEYYSIIPQGQSNIEFTIIDNESIEYNFNTNTYQKTYFKTGEYDSVSFTDLSNYSWIASKYDQSNNGTFILNAPYTLTLPAFSQAPQTCRSIEDTVFNAMNLGIVAIIVLIASVLIGAVMAFGGANFDVGTITATVLTVILVAIMFLIGTVVVATIGGTIC